MINPRLLQTCHILPVDLVQRGISPAAVITVRSVPRQERLPLGISIGRCQLVRLRGGNDFIQGQLFSLLWVFDRPVVVFSRIARALPGGDNLLLGGSGELQKEQKYANPS